MPAMFRNIGVVCGEIPDALFESGEGSRKVLRNMRLMWGSEEEDFWKVLGSTDPDKEFFSDVQEVQLQSEIQASG